MRYLLTEFEGVEYWIEVDLNGYALRQVVVDENNIVHVSSLEDCLAEGKIIEEDLGGTTKHIASQTFEEKWLASTNKKRGLWHIQKKENPIGTKVRFIVLYSYPQGWILGDDELFGVYVGDNITFGQWFTGEVIGYDEVNMWLKISDVSSI